MTETSRLHHVVFAVPAPHHDEMAKMFTELGFQLNGGELDELGIRVSLDWPGGIELISPLSGATTDVAASVERFLAAHGSGVYTVVVQVPEAAAAESVTQRYGSVTRFRQQIGGEGTHLEEIDLSVLDLPLTLLETNVP